MLIGLLSDTHIAFTNQALPPQIKTAFSGVDLILHAGDIWIPSVLDDLEAIAPVIAAWGDDDMEFDLGNDKRMLKEQSLYLDGVHLWLRHIKPRYGLIAPGEEPSILKRNSQEPIDPPDVVIFGHTHFPAVESYKGILLVNPGSATMPNYVPKPGTVGLLTLSSGEVRARIVQLGEA